MRWNSKSRRETRNASRSSNVRVDREAKDKLYSIEGIDLKLSITKYIDAFRFWHTPFSTIKGYVFGNIEYPRNQ